MATQKYNYTRIDWGVRDYRESLTAMREQHAKRAAGETTDAIICVEHPRVFTLGKHGERANVLLSDEELKEKGFAYYQVERGGDVTYHGPGQAVIYPVISLRERRMGVRALVTAVEKTVCQVARDYGIDAGVDPDKPGAWVGGAKLAAIGMAVPQKVTMHGLAMNVNTRLGDFDYIKACGLSAKATSLKQELGREIDLAEVFDKLFDRLCENFRQAENTLVV